MAAAGCCINALQIGMFSVASPTGVGWSLAVWLWRSSESPSSPDTFRLCVKQVARGQVAAVTEAEVTERSKALVPTGPWPQHDERGMANTLGPGTWERCAYNLSQPQAKSYELSHVRSNTMPMSPLGQPLLYEPTPSVALPGTRHVFNGERVLGGEPGAQGTQMDALGHFASTDPPWDGTGDAPVAMAQYYGGYTQADVKPTPNSPLLKLGIEKAPPIITSAVLLDARTYV